MEEASDEIMFLDCLDFLFLWNVWISVQRRWEISLVSTLFQYLQEDCLPG
jgi:hypothetical protein